jgi:hypothetical protein
MFCSCYSNNRGVTPPGRAPYSSVKSSNPQRAELIKGDSAIIREDISAAMVIMVIMLVLVEELLCQDSRGWSPVLESFLVRSMWVSVVMSHHARS